MNSTLSIATLVGSRICHDLISPVGAINNGLELISMGGPVDTPELSLINDSVTNASARIKFFRIAFGVASAEQVLGAPEVKAIAEAHFGEGRTRATWIARGDIPRAFVQAAFLAMLCVEAALPLGGMITVSKDVSGYWTVRGTGKRIRADETLWTALAEGRAPAEMQPSVVQFGLLPMALAEIPRVIEIAQDEEQIEIGY